MKRSILLSALFSMVLFLGTLPAAAQVGSVAVALFSEAAPANESAAAAHAADVPAIAYGIPALRKPLPEFVYPGLAEQFLVEGRVLIEYTVNERGHAKDIRILEGPGFGCGDEVTRVLRAAHFQPALGDDGQAEARRYRAAFEFRLH